MRRRQRGREQVASASGRHRCGWIARTRAAENVEVLAGVHNEVGNLLRVGEWEGGRAVRGQDAGAGQLRFSCRTDERKVGTRSSSRKKLCSPFSRVRAASNGGD